MIIVTGTFTLDPAKADDARQVMLTAMEETRKEEGCEGYAFTADLAEPGVFHVVEQWTDLEAIEKHMKSPHLAALVAAMPGLGVTRSTLWQHEVGASNRLM